MIITGIIVTASAVILSIFAIVGVIGGTAAESEKTALGSLAFYFLCAIGYIVGLALVAIGVAQEVF